MVDNDNGFKTVSITVLLLERAEKLFRKAGFSTRTGYIQDRLRRAVESDEKEFGGGNGGQTD